MEIGRRVLSAYVCRFGVNSDGWVLQRNFLATKCASKFESGNSTYGEWTRSLGTIGAQKRIRYLRRIGAQKRIRFLRRIGSQERIGSLRRIGSQKGIRHGLGNSRNLLVHVLCTSNPFANLRARWWSTKLYLNCLEPQKRIQTSSFVKPNIECEYHVQHNVLLALSSQYLPYLKQMN